MKSIKKLQLAQNCAARIIDRTPRRTHMAPVLRDLHWLPIVKRCQYKILVFTYNVLHQNAPQYNNNNNNNNNTLFQTIVHMDNKNI